MLCRRIIPCLDVSGDETVKGVNFGSLAAVGDPVELASRYQEEGADEIVVLDVAATPAGRRARTALVSKVADVLMIPLTVGGGVRGWEDARSLLESGADKISVNTAAVETPSLIGRIAGSYGSQCCVLAVDARRSGPSAWTVLVRSGGHDTGLEALEWGLRAVEEGTGEILLTSWDRDGTRTGFDLELTRLFSEHLPVPVIASGGAGRPEDFLEVFLEGGADAALAASVFHYGSFSIGSLKEFLANRGVEVRR